MKKTGRKLLFFLLIPCLLSQGCEEDSELDKIRSDDDHKIRTYITENEISAQKHESGIYYQQLVENTSAPKVNKGDIVLINYTFSILDGNNLDINEDTVIAFEQGVRALIPYGLDIGCKLMHKGERFRFFIPSLLAFNGYKNTRYDLPSNAILICEAEVIDLKSKEGQLESETDSVNRYIEKNGIEDIDKYSDGLYFKKLTTVEKGTRPSDGSFVKIHFERRYLDGTIHYSTFNNDPVSFRLGSGSAVKGLEEGIKLLKPGEKALLILPSEIAFGASIQVAPHELRQELIDDDQIRNIPEPFSPVIYEVELLNIYY
jgi:FKBP-type peptidyl-prolyl cis-trans isomerase